MTRSSICSNLFSKHRYSDKNQVLDKIICKRQEKYSLQTWSKFLKCYFIKYSFQLFVVPDSNLTKSDSLHSLDHSISLSDERGEIFDSSNGCDFLILVQSASENVQDDGTQEVVETPICAHKHILSQFPLFNASEGINNITVNVSQSCQPHVTTFIRYAEITMACIDSRYKTHIDITNLFCQHVTKSTMNGIHL